MIRTIGPVSIPWWPLLVGVIVATALVHQATAPEADPTAPEPSCVGCHAGPQESPEVSPEAVARALARFVR